MNPISIDFDDPHLRITISEYRDEYRLDIRHLWVPKDSETGEAVPTKKGINLPLSSAEALLSVIHEALLQAGAINEDTRS